LKKLFAKASDYLQEPILTDPANNENVIDAYLDEDDTRQELLDLIGAYNEIANTAYRYEIDGNYEKAVSEWKKIFESDDGGNSGSEERRMHSPTIITKPPKQHYYVAVNTK
jgi:hypothetical protein